tara:strand:- start:5714 stop:7312 length:1599 start_codon:yes stop_codon:yes gene_type:complete
LQGAMSYSLTKKQIVKEVVKAGKDPVYFINNYCRISHPLEGLVPFSTYDYQDDLLKDFEDYRFNVVLKGRQLGISTITAGYVVWMMLFHRDKNILVMATKFSTAANLVKKVKSIMRTLPEWMQISKISVDNRTSFELHNGSQIKASSTSSDAGRSEALSLLVIDEAAHVEGLEELWTGLYPTLSTGGRCIALSTPNGVGNWFHKTCVDAGNGSNDFKLTTLPWSAHPDRDQEWFEKETKNMSRRQIAQELECNFNMSGETVIHSEDMERMLASVCEPKYRTGHDRNYWIWEEYQSEGSYLLTADIARGDGKDFSAFHILRLDTMEIIAEYQGKPTPDAYAEILYSAGNEYGTCMIVGENNNIGFTVLNKLIERGYPSIYHSKKSSHEYVDSYSAEFQTGVVPGFTTSAKTRPLVIAKMEEFIRNKLIKINSNRLLTELKTFVWQNGRPQAMRSYNDDLVMSLAIGCWVRDTVLIENQRDVEYNKAFLNTISKSNSVISTTIPGMHGHKRIEKTKQMNEAAKINKEFVWLLKG